MKKIRTLESELQEFEVADDYYQIKQEADEIKNRLDKTQKEDRT